MELCARLDLDGLTPDFNTISKTRDAIDIGLHVIIRPREGDFTVSPEELKLMLQSIEACRKLGVDGVVFGVLSSDGSLDLELMQTLIQAAKPLSITFHRAFDVCVQPLRVFRQSERLGVHRVLTSGQAEKAIDGLNLISELVQQESSVKVMAGSGVNATNVLQLWNAGVRQFHFTSHKQNEHGINRFDSEKTRTIVKKLEEVCGI